MLHQDCKYTSNISLPGHDLELQRPTWVSASSLRPLVSDKRHFKPPPDGAGLLHERDLDRFPLPQDLLHEV